MSLGIIHGNKHIHLWAKTVDGAEFFNTIYENEVDAATNFLAIVVNIRKYDTSGNNIDIEQVMLSLEEGRGIYAGYPGLVVVLSRCEGSCNSPSWN